jgi:O-antigen/teichoic acid export membrane protein
VVPPFVQAFQPRLTTLLAQGRRAEFVSLYRLSLALIMVLTVALAGSIAAQPEMVIYAWTGSRAIAAALAPTLSLYALGTGISAFLFVPYVLQFAQGMIRLHLIGNLVFGVLWVPCAIWAAVSHGTVGAGVAWLVGNALFVLIWAPLVHRRLLSPEERRGLGLSALARAALLLLLLAATRWIDPGALSRLGALAVLASLSLAALALGILISRELRAYGKRMIGMPAWGTSL